MQEVKHSPQAYILKTKSGQWAWELHLGDELYQAGAGYDSEGDAINGMYESTSDRFESVNIVLTPEAGK
jgi:uncharacterized protein YegP (UPF0339 family)